MAVRHLTAVPSRPFAGKAAAAEVYDLGRGPESVTERLRRLQQEARMLAREQVEALVRDLDALALRAADIGDGGEAYPVGVREMALRIATDLPQKGEGLMAILNRTARA